jgi:hypothetical protein
LGTYTFSSNPTLGGVSIGASGTGFTADANNLLFTTATPEPAAVGLFGVGAVGLLLVRRRKA